MASSVNKFVLFTFLFPFFSTFGVSYYCFSGHDSCSSVWQILRRGVICCCDDSADHTSHMAYLIVLESVMGHAGRVMHVEARDVERNKQ